MSESRKPHAEQFADLRNGLEDHGERLNRLESRLDALNGHARELAARVTRLEDLAPVLPRLSVPAKPRISAREACARLAEEWADEAEAQGLAGAETALRGLAAAIRRGDRARRRKP